MNMATRPPTPAALPELWSTPPRDDERSERMRRNLTIVVGIFLVLLLLAAVVPIGGAVIGTGQVGVATRVKRIAHPTGGVISQIAVVNGEHVNAGQLLMRLDENWQEGSSRSLAVLDVRLAVLMDDPRRRLALLERPRECARHVVRVDVDQHFRTIAFGPRPASPR